MKFKKRTAMIVSFAVGILLFATTALAEIAAKNGYEQMKDAVKATSSKLTTEGASYTTEMSAVLKDNGTVISSQEAVTKQDVKKNMYESTTTNIYGTDKFQNYFYSDKDKHISFNSKEGVYYVAEINGGNDNPAARDPFKEKEAEDIERIIDALVGNLKDYVVVSQNSDGSKELSGSLNETQIPALVNAVASYTLKREFGGRANAMPRITQDVYVKEVKGKMVVDKNGLVQSVFGTGVLYGKDENGKEHSLSFEVLGKVTNINSTVVTTPDLTGKKVEKRTEPGRPDMANLQMYAGTYKNNIIIEKDGKFVKIGERILNISQIDNKTVSGSYKEVYVSGYEEYAGSIKDFSFTGNIEKDGMAASFELPESSGLSGRGGMNFVPMSAKVYFHPDSMPNGRVQYDGEFSRVFE